jgi:uridine kinase
VNLSVAHLVSRVSAAEPRLGSTRLVLIDGPAGAGKTKLADRIADVLRVRSGAPVPVVHGDDIYEGWTGLGTMWPILGTQILEPLSRGEGAVFLRWDWARGERGDEVRIEAGLPVLVIEGVGVAQRLARPYASLVVYVDAPRDVRLARGVARDGEAMRTEWERWQTAEATFLDAEATRDAADVLIDGTTAVG